MRQAIERFTASMEKLAEAQRLEQPLWEKLQLAGADLLAYDPQCGAPTIAEAWYAARLRTHQLYVEAMDAAQDVAKRAGLSVDE